MNNLLSLHKGEEILTWEAICQEHIYFALTEAEKRFRKELDTDSFYILPMGSFLNLKLLSEISGIELTKDSLKHFISDIDILIMTDILPEDKTGTFYALAERLDPIVNRFISMNTGIELCYVYNLELHPTQYKNPDAFIPYYEVKSQEDNLENASLTLASIGRMLEAINVATLFGKGNFYQDFIETLEIAFQSDKFKTRDTKGYREFLAKELEDPNILSYTGNILIYVVNKLYKPGYPALKPKHIIRALDLKYGRMPTQEEISATIDTLTGLGYRITPIQKL